jgi:hypothetical protein
MADYRRRLSDMTPEEREEVAPSADNFSKVFGDRTEEPMSVAAADTAVSLATPVDSIVEVQKELQKEEPDYLKIGMLAGVEALGSLPALGPAAKSMIRKGADLSKQTDTAIEGTTNIPAVSARSNTEFKNTVKGYKLFTRGEDDKLYPLFVDADTEVPVGSYMKAVFPEYRFKAENGNYYVPSRGTKGKKGTGDSIKIPDQETRDMLIKAGFLAKGSKAKTIKAVAARPGWHAGDNPTAAHIGPEVKVGGKSYKIRGGDQVWAEVEMPADVDWQEIANSRAILKKDGTPNVKTAHITDELPFGGYYRYKTNPNMQGNWLISGEMKVNRILDRDEVKKLNAEAGVEDLPTESELREKLGKGFASGGLVGEDMYQGLDDYQMAEMGAGMKEDQTQMAFALGGSVEDVDPVSGNEVPTGSLPEEVRDDIPAQLSEGEYVVPADVVRYYGVKFFEDLRGQAKMGFNEMEANGRIGGEPVAPQGMEMGADELPFDVSELQFQDDGQPMQMNEGGFATQEQLQKEFPNAFVGQPNNASEFRVYTNEAGQTISIRFVNGNPVSAIPPGYTPVASAAAAVEPTPQRRGGDGSSDKPRPPAAEAIDWKTADDDVFRKTIDQMGTGKLAMGLAGAINPVVGLLGGAAMRHQTSQMQNALNEKIKALDPKSESFQADKDKYQGMLDDIEKSRKKSSGKAIFGGKESMLDGLKDRDGDGVNFGDTWLGDLLGFDQDGAGVQGAGLSDSLGGARRGDDDNNDSSSPSPNFDGSAKNSVTGTSWSDPDKKDTSSNNSGGSDDNYSAAQQMADIQAQNKKDFTPEAGKEASMTGWDE